jgi:hypothetical protein
MGKHTARPALVPTAWPDGDDAFCCSGPVVVVVAVLDGSGAEEDGHLLTPGAGDSVILAILRRHAAIPLFYQTVYLG